MTSSPLLSAIAHTCADAPKAAIENACTHLNAANTDALTALAKLTGILSKDSLVRLKRGVKGTPTTARELALALASTNAGIELGRATPDLQLVWTGPDSPAPSPRDTLPQMLEMIGRAKSSILLVTFAAFKAKSIMQALLAAFDRGVELTIIVESSEDSAKQLTHASWKAFPQAIFNSGCIWHWPLDRRPTNAKGLAGKLHAKCLVIDKAEVFVSSANLTDDAMERNIEVGLRCANEILAQQISNKFASLQKQGSLKKVI